MQILLKRNEFFSMISISKHSKINEAIKNGFLVVYPTDTLYALGANVFDEKAVHQVFSIKKRPLSLPIPIAVSSVEMLKEIAILTPLGKILAEHFLPGPLTLILENKSVSTVVTANKKTIAVRIPDDPIALNLIEKTGPLTVTSANIHDQLTPTTIYEIRNMFKSESIVTYIDDGERNGLASTIVDVTSNVPMILRKGTISSDEIDAVVS
ncbi:threonylcarbamoyl-AMP synthase [Thermoplasmatales archaeon ex4572_165]|nr:MAG: threonylcarbamoyl-AMP synthase [Thermoplasmatales archaeon ex4572_165]